VIGPHWRPLAGTEIVSHHLVRRHDGYQQQYSFQAPVDGALMVLLGGTIVTVVYYLCVPFVPSPSTRA